MRRNKSFCFHGLNPIFETLGKDALCSEWRHNGQDGKVASTHVGVQAAGRGANEDLPKHWCSGTRTEVAAETAVHLEVPVRGPAGAAVREFGNNRRRPQREIVPR